MTAATVPTRPAWAGDVPIDQVIADPRQPRKHFERAALESLAASVKSLGIIEPLVVRPVDPKAEGSAVAKYVLVAGERRLRAARAAGLRTVPVVVRSYEPQQAHVVQLAENMDREGLTPIEIAESYAHWLAATGQTQAQLARVLGKTEAHVSQLLSLTLLPSVGRKFLEKRGLGAAHGRELARLFSPSAPPNGQDLLAGVLDTYKDHDPDYDPPITTDELKGEVDEALRRVREKDEKAKAAATARKQAAEQRVKVKKDAKEREREKVARAQDAARREKLEAEQEREAVRDEVIVPEVIAARAGELAKRVRKIRDGLAKAPAGVLAWLVDSIDQYEFAPWNGSATVREAFLRPAILGKLPGKWDKGFNRAKDAAGEVSLLAFGYWIARETKGLDAEIDKLADTELKAMETAQAVVNARKAPARKGGRK